MISFNPEINLGTVISLLTFIFLAGGFYVSVKTLFKQVAAMQEDLIAFREDLKLLNKVITDVALSNQRQDNFETRYNRETADLRDDVKELRQRLERGRASS